MIAFANQKLHPPVMAKLHGHKALDMRGLFVSAVLYSSLDKLLPLYLMGKIVDAPHPWPSKLKHEASSTDYFMFDSMVITMPGIYYLELKLFEMSATTVREICQTTTSLIEVKEVQSLIGS